MNKVILLALLVPGMASGQITESFESGNLAAWIQSPEGRWNADNSNTISGALSLHHTFDNPGSGNDRIGISLMNLRPDEGIVKWSFKIRYGAEPSSTNNWTVYLMSDYDPASLSGSPPVNGYAAGVNLTGYDDTLRIWKIKDGTPVPFISSGINWQTDIGTAAAVMIDITRYPSGLYEIKVLKADNSLIRSSSGTDPELFSPELFIFSYNYTSSRDRLLWIDDVIIDGVFREDKTPPEIIQCRTEGKSSLIITFSEAVTAEILVPDNFTIRGSENTVTDVTKISPQKIKLKFDKEFHNGLSYTLLIKRICDEAGNCLINVSTSFFSSWAKTGDIIISEIMADPDPAVSLPAEEYIEILNRSGSEINLKSWKLATDAQSYSFPPMIIDPQEYIIVCPVRDTSLFNHYGRTAGMHSFPSLTDRGRVIALLDSSGNLIHGLEYSSKWYHDLLKSEGGWSLEIIDKDYPFYQDDNWTSSVSRSGGTPGKINSVSRSNPDTWFTGVTNVFADDSVTLSLGFSETITGVDVLPVELKVEKNEIKKITQTGFLPREFSLKISSPLEKGIIYSIASGNEIRDFAGNRAEISKFSFGLPEIAGKGDIIFNELLFNPFPGEPDFAEFYNNSDRIVDVARLMIASVDSETGDTSSVCFLSEKHRCLLPGEYYAVTTDRKAVIDRYPSSDACRIFEIPDLPSMPDDKGHLILLNRELDLVDEVFYDEKMHYSLLSGYEGISLERVVPQGSSADRTLWHSASEAAGWGTPGNKNSVFKDQPVSDDQIVLSATRITPDNDGIDDILVIDFKLSGIDNVVSVTIYDESGGFVKKLTENLLAGREASIIWNGTADDGKLVYNGIYILLISVFDDAGKSHRWKKVCTVVKR